MEFQRVVRLRRMVRAFRPDPVAPESLERILRLARKAPSAGFSQGQSFVVIDDPEVLARVRAAYGRRGRTAGDAPVHVVVCTSERIYRDRYSEPDKLLPDGSTIEWPVPYWWVDAGCSVMLLLLAAVDEGLSGWFFGWPDYGPLKEVLGIPEHVTPIGLVAIGHGAPDTPSPSLERGWKPEPEVVHRNAW